MSQTQNAKKLHARARAQSPKGYWVGVIVKGKHRRFPSAQSAMKWAKKRGLSEIMDARTGQIVKI